MFTKNTLIPIGILCLSLASTHLKALEQKEISAQELNTIKASVTLLSVDTEETYIKAHIEGAKNIPFDDTFIKIVDKQPWSTTMFVVIYDEQEDDAMDAAKKLISKGFTNVHILTGGLRNWKIEGLPTHTKCRECLKFINR